MGQLFLSRSGVRRTDTGEVLGQPDEGSQTAARPCGLFQGRPVMGFWRAYSLGLFRMEFVPCEPYEVRLDCGCCYGLRHSRRRMFFAQQ